MKPSLQGLTTRLTCVGGKMARLTDQPVHCVIKTRLAGAAAVASYIAAPEFSGMVNAFGRFRFPSEVCRRGSHSNPNEIAEDSVK